MWLIDIFKVNQYKRENEDMKLLLNSPEGQEGMELSTKLRELRESINVKQMEYNNCMKQVEFARTELNRIRSECEIKKAEIIDLSEKIDLQSYGMYKPIYDFANSTQYKDSLSEIRAKEKLCIKNGMAVSGNMNWKVNGNDSEGKRMVKDMQKLLLRAFNSDADEVISKCKYNNYAQCEKKIRQSADITKKLGKIMQVFINDEYINLKLSELQLALEYRMKKEAEKEEMKELRVQEREAAKLAKEIAEARKKTKKEQTHYINALKKINEQLETVSDTEKAALLDKKAELENDLQEIGKQLQDIDYRETNQRAGYVYIISNIGAFGNDIFKIGLTRRLEPMDRIDELSDASVPFRFDVHAMIFSTDAVSLESALHKAFEKKKVNLVNGRKEFFHVTLDEIKAEVIKNFDKTVEFVDVPEAIQFRESEQLRANIE